MERHLENGFEFNDAVTSESKPLVSIATLFVIVSLAACYWPARRATKVDPISALRHE